MIEKIINITRNCGDILKNASAKNVEIKHEDNRNLVTEYDTKIEQLLKKELLVVCPEAKFLGEEKEKNFTREGYTFVCDPIDGTTNFIKGLKHSGVSVALLKDGYPIIGVIYDPFLDEMFWAEKGKGAFLGNQKINTTDAPLQKSLIVFGTSPYNESLHPQTWELAQKSMSIALDVRRNGAAVLDLTGVSVGRFGLYWELETQPWDYAAGSLIVEEAGGIITDIKGQPISDYFSSTSIIASASKEHLRDFL